MIVGGDLHLAGAAIQDGLVDTPVTELQLVGVEPKGTTEDLVTEADTEKGHLGAEHVANQLDGGVSRRRVAGAVGDEDAVGAHGTNIGQGAAGREDVDLDTALGQPERSHRLDAQIQRGDGEPLLTSGGHSIRLLSGDVGNEVRAGHLRLGANSLEQAFRIDLGGGDPDPHRAAVAQVPGEGAGVDAADPDNTLSFQGIVQAELRSPTGGHARRISHDVARHPDPRGLVVLVVPAGVADVRGGGDHDLAVVAGVGQGFLIPGHCRGEHGFSERLPSGSEAVPVKGATVLQNQDGRGRGIA